MRLLPEDFQSSGLEPVFKHLVRGHQYSVLRSFQDFDAGVHLPGETWIFLGKSFFPYEDGLSLFVRCDGVDYQLRFQWRDEAQGPIISELGEYIQEFSAV